MDFEMIELPNDSNPMVRITTSNYVTAADLKQIKKECMRQFKTASHMVKAKLHRIACSADAILEDKVIPNKGLAVVGPFMGRDVAFPAKGDIVKLSAGIKVFSNMPKLLGKVHHETKSRKIRVADVSAGYVNLHNRGEIADPMIIWELHGGNSAWTSVRNALEKGVSGLELQEVG